MWHKTAFYKTLAPEHVYNAAIEDPASCNAISLFEKADSITMLR